MKISSVEPYRINSNPLIVTRHENLTHPPSVPSLPLNSPICQPGIIPRTQNPLVSKRVGFHLPGHARVLRTHCFPARLCALLWTAPSSTLPHSSSTTHLPGVRSTATPRRPRVISPSSTSNRLITRPIKEHHRCNGYTLKKDTCTFIFVFVSGNGTLGDITF